MKKYDSLLRTGRATPFPGDPAAGAVPGVSPCRRRRPGAPGAGHLAAAGYTPALHPPPPSPLSQCHRHQQSCRGDHARGCLCPLPAPTLTLIAACPGCRVRPHLTHDYSLDSQLSIALPQGKTCVSMMSMHCCPTADGFAVLVHQ